MSGYRDRIYKAYASGFQDAGPQFDFAAAARWGRAFDWYLRGWLPEDKSAPILEVACGQGKLLSFFKKRGFHNISGVDVSPEQIALARQVVPTVHEANVLEFLEAHPGQFELIVGFDIIEHFNKDEVLRFLDGCRLALKTGGRLILQTPNADSPLVADTRYGDFTHEVCFQMNSLGRLLRLCGFKDIVAREQGPIPHGYSFLSTVRWLIWQCIRILLKIYNFAETGGPGSSVFTRVFLVCGFRG